jgi:hypothetical protein
MDRITGTTQDLGGGRRGFRGRNIALGQAGTVPGETWFNDVQEEILAPIEALGLAPTAGNRAQLLQALRRIAGGNVRVITSSTALSADDAGVILVSAASGALSLTLPAAAAAGGRPLRFNIIRTDSTSNAVTITRAGTDTIEGATDLLLPRSQRVLLVGDGAGQWFVGAEAATGRNLGANGWQRLPGGLIVQWGYFLPPNNSSQSWAITFPVAFPGGPLAVFAQLNNVTASTGTVAVYSQTPGGFAFIQSWNGGQTGNLALWWLALGV